MLDRLRLAVRPRSPWEATDLGLALLRAQAGPVYAVWLALVAPLALILGLACPRWPWLAPLALWWLKPALDRPVLHVLAKATFGETPGFWSTLRGLPGYCRRGLPASLLWRRFSLERSLLLPVWQLEEPGPAAFRKRRQVLCQRGRTQARLLTLVCILFMGVLAAGLVTGLAYFWPGTHGWNLLEALFADRGRRLPWLDALAWTLPTLTMAAVEPYYVAAGFGLYLNRRVQLEGWDLEQAFRPLGQRVRGAGGRARAGLALAVLLALAPLQLRAQPEPQRPLSPAKAALAEVMKAPEFATLKPVWHLRLRRPVRAQAPSAPLPAWVGRVATLLATLFKWLVPVGAAFILIRLLRIQRRDQPLPAGPAAPAPERLFGLDIRPAALPRDIPGTALRLWDQGEARAALALLYRGALAELARSLRAPLPAGVTEGECLRLAGAGLADPGVRYLARLMATWQGVAYGGKAAASQDRELCLDWAHHFPARPTGARS